MHASHAPLFGPGCDGQSWAAGMLFSFLSALLPAVPLLDDAMLFSGYLGLTAVLQVWSGTTGGRWLVAAWSVRMNVDG